MIDFTPINIRTWSMLGTCGAFGQAAMCIPEIDDRIVMLTSDLCTFSGLDRFKAKFPDRLYNFGIAEQNMVGVAAGFAKEGFIPFATTYASFASMRCADQVKVNMGYMGFPIKLVGLTAGYAVGSLGATHMSLEDIAVMRAIPNIVVISPADCTAAVKATIAAATCDKPVYLRLSGGMNNPIVYKSDFEFEIGKAIVLREGVDVSLIATGSMVNVALKAADALASRGLSVEVVDMHTIKPIDEQAIRNACSKRLIVTLEEHSRIGGLGSAVAEVLALSANRPPHLILGAEDQYPHAMPGQDILRAQGLVTDTVAQRILGEWKQEVAPFVSVCFTCYNQREFVRQALLSVLQQTYSNMEVVICDDASTDGTSEIVKEIVDNYEKSEGSRFKVRFFRSEKNQGVVANVSKCFELAEGKLLIQAHDDDISKPNRVSDIVAAWVAAGKKPTAVLHGWDFIDTENRILGGRGPFGRGRPTTGRTIKWLKETWPHGAAAAYVPSVVKNFPPIEARDAFEDVVFLYRAKMLGDPLYMEERLLYYRIGSGCTTSSRVGIRKAQGVKGRKGFAAGEQAYKDLDFARAFMPTGWYDELKEVIGCQTQQFRDVYECFAVGNIFRRWKLLRTAPNLMLLNMPRRQVCALAMVFPWIVGGALLSFLVRMKISRICRRATQHVSTEPPFDVYPISISKEKNNDKQ